MIKYWFLFILLLGSSNTYCWDFASKLDIQRSTTNNVNLAEINPIKDNFTTLRGYIQTKNELFKVKFRGRMEKYKLQNANDNYLLDLSLAYKHSLYDDYTFGIFKQAFDGPTIISTDTTSDNIGGKFSADFSKDFDDKNYGYLSLNSIYKKYSKISGRTDSIFGATFGAEYYFFSRLMLNPELTVHENLSTLAFYRNLSWGPNLYITLNLFEPWDIFANFNYTKVNYSGRTASVVIDGLTQSIKENQKLIEIDFGTIYKITKSLSLQIKYSTENNTSNNPVSIYKADKYLLGLSIKF